MKIKELRELSKDELVAKRNELKKLALDSRVQHVGGQLSQIIQQVQALAPRFVMVTTSLYGRKTFSAPAAKLISLAFSSASMS